MASALTRSGTLISRKIRRFGTNFYRA